MHIEAVPNFDKDHCLKLFMRFIAWRGRTCAIIIDNQTNLVGAEGEFGEYVAAWKKEGIGDHQVLHGFKWKFNPRARMQDCSLMSVQTLKTWNTNNHFLHGNKKNYLRYLLCAEVINNRNFFDNLNLMQTSSE